MIRLNQSFRGIFITDFSTDEDVLNVIKKTVITSRGREFKLLADLPELVIQGVAVDLNGDGTAIYKPTRTKTISKAEWLKEAFSQGFIFDINQGLFVIKKFVFEFQINPQSNYFESDLTPSVGYTSTELTGSIITEVAGVVADDWTFRGRIVIENQGVVTNDIAQSTK